MAEFNTETTVATDTTSESEVTGTETETKTESDSAELARLRAELAKQKAALDKATKEAGDARKALRAKQTAEEAAAEEAKTLQESMREELEQLRKEKAVASVTAKVMPLIGNDEVATKVAEYLYGAEDIESAIAEITKAWNAKEKALRLEFGKIPKPGVGANEGSTITKAELDAMTYIQRVEFATKFPEEYEHLMGRK